MSKLFGKPSLNGPGNIKSNFPHTPTQVKPDWGNDQTQNCLPFPTRIGKNRNIKNYITRR